LKNRTYGILLIFDKANMKYIRFCSLSSDGFIEFPKNDEVKS